MSNTKILTQRIQLPNATLELRSEAFEEDGYRPLDTEVAVVDDVDNDVLFVISGDTIDDFKKDLSELVDKYRI